MKIMLAVLAISIGCTAQVVSGVSVGSPFSYNSNYPTHYLQGDTFATTWADDGNIYTTTNDTHGWNDALNPSGRNMMVSTLSSYTSSVVGTMVNSMDIFGNFATGGCNGWTFKTGGLISISGTLYLWANCQDDSTGFEGQYQSNYGQLIKSSDHGVTWTPLPPGTGQNYVSPMFASGFTTARFVQYGQDYACPASNPDSCSTYVYSISSSGTNNNGDYLIIGRVLKSAIGNLSASDWTFYQSDGSWGALGTAKHIYAVTGQSSQLGLQWIPNCLCYFGIEWYNKASNDIPWTFLTAQHPWGPFTVVGTYEWCCSHGYGAPDIIPSSVSGNTLTATGAGGNQGDTGDYTLTLIPLTLDIFQGSSLGTGAVISNGVELQ